MTNTTAETTPPASPSLVKRWGKQLSLSMKAENTLRNTLLWVFVPYLAVKGVSLICVGELGLTLANAPWFFGLLGFFYFCYGPLAFIGLWRSAFNASSKPAGYFIRFILIVEAYNIFSFFLNA
jgi:uncharacterized membrane protein YiaA